MTSAATSSTIVTTNGDPAHATTGNLCLDFFVRITRSSPVSDLIQAFDKAWYENQKRAVQLLLNLRDCRDGKGEKHLSQVLLVHLKSHLSAEDYTTLLTEFIKYGYWKDLLRVAEISYYLGLSNGVEFQLFAIQLKSDNEILRKVVADANPDNDIKEGISLAAKWAPSEGTRYGRAPLRFDTSIGKFMGLTPVQYRKTLSSLRKHLAVLEYLMSTGQYHLINFSHVPAAALRKLRAAFTRSTNADGLESSARIALALSYQDYLTKLTRGETKANSKGTQPHELTRHYLEGGETDAVIDAQWAALLEKVTANGCFDRTIAVVDVSGSMSNFYGTNVKPVDVAIALGLLVARATKGLYHGQVITFESNPKWHTVAGINLKDDVVQLTKSASDFSTNVRAPFDLILAKAQAAKLTQAEMPTKVFIFTDMQFDQADGRVRPDGETALQYGARIFHDAGYVAPQIICWNLATSSSKSLPATINSQDGLLMLSGFSSELLKHVLAGEDLSCLNLLEHVLSVYPQITFNTSLSDNSPALEAVLPKCTIKKHYKKGAANHDR